MLDVNIIRKEPEKIREMLINRNLSDEVLNRFLETDGEWKSLMDRGNRLRQERNAVSAEIPKLSGEEKKERIDAMKVVSDEIKRIESETIRLALIRDDCVLNIPNIPHPSVPVGKDASDNVVVCEWGNKREFDFKPKEHFEIGEDLDIIDFERGVKIAGSGFYVLKGDGARLERALISYFLDENRKRGY